MFSSEKTEFKNWFILLILLLENEVQSPKDRTLACLVSRNCLDLSLINALPLPIIHVFTYFIDAIPLFVFLAIILPVCLAIILAIVLAILSVIPVIIPAIILFSPSIFLRKEFGHYTNVKQT